MSSKLILDSLESDLIPGAIEYAVLLPEGYDPEGEPLPLLINMHGGGLDRNYLAEPEVIGIYEKLWAEGALPPMVVACYTARGGWHMNYKDGSEMWEDFYFEFAEFMQNNYNVGKGAEYIYLTGISMGAMGSMRLTLKYPERIAAVAAMEGVINPVLNYDDLQPRNYGMQHNGGPELQGPRWGWPVDKDHYHANNHANIAENNAEAIRKAAPGLYLECGDRDYYNAHDGAEFLHRVLWENHIEHEYRLLRNCDHVGSSLVWRVEDAHRFLGREAKRRINPQPLPEPTAAQQDYMNRAYKGLVTAPPTAAEKLGLSDEETILAHRRSLPKFLADYADDPTGGPFRKAL